MWVSLSYGKEGNCNVAAMSSLGDLSAAKESVRV